VCSAAGFRNQSVFNTIFLQAETTAGTETENYYTLPKDFMHVYFNEQQQILEQIVIFFRKKKILQYS
jgi:hypothetical protein